MILRTWLAWSNTTSICWAKRCLLCAWWPPRVFVTPLRWSRQVGPRRTELNKLHTKWLQIQLAAWKLPPGFPSAQLSACGCSKMHQVVPMMIMQALANHVEQLVALPDELRETAICKYKRLCELWLSQ